jgi:hypothetical protein
MRARAHDSASGEDSAREEQPGASALHVPAGGAKGARAGFLPRLQQGTSQTRDVQTPLTLPTEADVAPGVHEMLTVDHPFASVFEPLLLTNPDSTQAWACLACSSARCRRGTCA